MSTRDSFFYIYNFQVLRCQYKGGKRTVLKGLKGNSTLEELQEKIWLLTDVPPQAQRSKQILMQAKGQIQGFPRGTVHKALRRGLCLTKK